MIVSLFGKHYLIQGFVIVLQSYSKNSYASRGSIYYVYDHFWVGFLSYANNTIENVL